MFFGERLFFPDPAVSSSPPSVEELLIREARALGLDRSDPLVLERLARLGESVASDATVSRQALEAEARRLGLDESDPVVRRRLAHAMELALARLGPSDLPDDEEVRRYYEAHLDHYAMPAHYRFVHVYFARDRGGTPSDVAASDAFEVFVEEGVGPKAAVSKGDAFMMGQQLGMTAPELARRFGEPFALAIRQAPLLQWLEPLASPFGWHVVWIDARTAPQAAPFESVKGRVVHDLLAQRSAERLRQRLKRVAESPSD